MYPTIFHKFRNMSLKASVYIALGLTVSFTSVVSAESYNQSSTDNAREIMMSNNVTTFDNDSLTWGTSNTNQINNYNQPSNNYYNELSTGSQGVAVFDLSTNSYIYEKNLDTPRPIASITKLMTALVLMDARQDMNELLYLETIDTQKRSVHEKSTNYLSVHKGDSLNRAEWLLIMLMKSENRAAKLLARNYPGGYTAFINAMNQKAQDLGMYSSWFADPSGLDKRNVASPSDLVKMIKAAGSYEVIRRFSTTKNYDFYMNNRVISARNTSYLVRNGVHNIGISKTGFIRESGKCYVMETMVKGRPSIVVILGARNTKVRWRDAENILSYLSNRYKKT